jgi:hypothetical protein
MCDKIYEFQDFRCVVASLREALLKGDFAVPSLTLLYESALMPAIKEGTPVGGRRAVRFIFTAVPVSTEVAVFICRRAD